MNFFLFFFLVIKIYIKFTSIFYLFKVVINIIGSKKKKKLRKIIN
jgi:hypothetical protein